RGRERETDGQSREEWALRHGVPPFSLVGAHSCSRPRSDAICRARGGEDGMGISGQAARGTGGASGLGGATAPGAAPGGRQVALLDMNESLAKTVAAEIGGIAVTCDVSDSASASSAVASARARHGAARVLVNCAGIGVAERIVGRDGPQDLAHFKRVIDINLV